MFPVFREAYVQLMRLSAGGCKTGGLAFKLASLSVKITVNSDPPHYTSPSCISAKDINVVNSIADDKDD